MGRELSPEPRSLWCQILCALRAGDTLPQLPQSFAVCALPVLLLYPLVPVTSPLGDALVEFSDVRIGHRSLEKESDEPTATQSGSEPARSLVPSAWT